MFWFTSAVVPAGKSTNIVSSSTGVALELNVLTPFHPIPDRKAALPCPPQQLCPSQFSCKPSKTNGMRPSLETFACICLDSSKDDLLTRSAQRLNWHVPQYVYINVSDTDPSPTLACLNASVSNAFDTLSQQPQPFSVSASRFSASIAIFASYTTLCPSVGPFYTSAWSLRHSVSSICLTVSIVLFTSSSMCGKSQFPLDASMWPPRQSITSMLRFASPMPRYVPVLSLSLIPAISALLDTFEASAQALDMSALPFKTSAPHPGLFPSILPAELYGVIASTLLPSANSPTVLLTDHLTASILTVVLSARLSALPVVGRHPPTPPRSISVSCAVFLPLPTVGPITYFLFDEFVLFSSNFGFADSTCQNLQDPIDSTNHEVSPLQLPSANTSVSSSTVSDGPLARLVTSQTLHESDARHINIVMLDGLVSESTESSPMKEPLPLSLPTGAEANETGRPSRTRRLPARFRDVLPEPPLPITSEDATPAEPDDSVPQSMALPRVILHVFDTIHTSFNCFGIARHYRHRPSYDPDAFMAIDQLLNSHNGEASIPIPSTPFTLPSLPWPWKNMSIWSIMTWMMSRSRQKSEAEVTRLGNILQADHFDPHDLQGFNVHTEMKHFDSSESTLDENNPL
ncbi:hypothetical protein SCLCIDRAFT_32939 [Scleroderma citrinum Foug A]|uniref:Uncharacterized protein n=1 Tax=Scleroderma citrinum Foug A TaxID=1036808 RepID=A0A0C3CU29_9AGAM|nr:hypothetical protein SCLCIDRAFT_32939 [Scleroderma citrinum Foug A]